MIRTVIAAALIASAAAQAAQLTPAEEQDLITRRICGGPECTVAADRSWHLLTQTYGGTISLLKDLTQHECGFAMRRALGMPATESEIAAGKGAILSTCVDSFGHMMSKSKCAPPVIEDRTITSAECFQ